MNIHPEQLEIIYQHLTEKLLTDNLVKYFVQNYPLATSFSYRSKNDEPATLRYYVKGREWSFPVEELHTVSERKAFLDMVLTDAEELIKIAHKDERILDFYLTKINNL